MLTAAVHPEKTQLGRGVVVIDERIENLERRRAIVADQQHIATGVRSGASTLDRTTLRCRRPHAE
ncbi:hypothetical protein, partial [Thiocapsa sp.]|uniref:hypothetical protein n=1 Tax=Thiocapsa sp. TaxID=2024551 RepID=UPI0034422FDC